MQHWEKNAENICGTTCKTEKNFCKAHRLLNLAYQKKHINRYIAMSKNMNNWWFNIYSIINGKLFVNQSTKKYWSDFFL